MNAIGIKIKKADGDHDPCASKFFGAPVVPEEWQERFSEDVIFFAQIRLSDIAELDTENKLPHTGSFSSLAASLYGTAVPYGS